MNERFERPVCIAEGGIGTVFRARDARLGREVAVKRIRVGETDASSSAVESLLHEARQQSLLRHPNIVAVYDAGVDEDGGFIVMELVEGETLEDILMRGALPLEEFEQVARQTLEGMSAAHAQGILHLDLKPGNLMITKPPAGGIQVKIIDFGLARAVADSVRQDAHPRRGLFGSVYFMAPEQFERAEADVRTDIYALGCIFYYALTQRYPFAGDTKPQVMVAHLHHHTQPLASLRPDLPPRLVQWIEWLTSRAPTSRPASMAEALRAYDEARPPPPYQ